MAMRINKYLASLGFGSRRAVDALIAQGKVRVNQQPAQLGMDINPEKDELNINGKTVNQHDNLEKKEYWKVYKPKGVISTASDPDGRESVVDLVSSAVRLYPVGRLDQESEGLVLLTNDGELTYKLTHPKFEIEKKYLVWVNGELSSKVVDHLERGVNIGALTTAPSKVEVIFREPRKAKFSIIIHEGYNRQIRRMCSGAGVMVTRLKRIQIGSLMLDDLSSGESRALTLTEIKNLKQITQLE